MERPEIEGPAEDLRALRGERATIAEKIRNAEGLVIQACQQAGITTHRYLDADGIERKVEIMAKPKASVERVRKPREKSDGGGDDDNGGGVEVS